MFSRKLERVMRFMRVSLGFDTSCYTTSAAAVDEQGEVLCSARMLLPVAVGQRGLRQSEAVFAHVKQMPLVMAQVKDALVGSNAEIVAVCASATPRDEADSYMPVFTVGLGHASVVANALNIPLFQTSHQQGHMAAGQLCGNEMGEHYVGLHISGGTTELLDCNGESLSLVGGTKDLNAGQLVDRVGVAMGLSFPAGTALESLAMRYEGLTEGILPCSLTDGDLSCHFSGAETRAQQLMKQGMQHERLAAEVFDLLARTLSRMLIAACERTNTNEALVVGGVASSTLLREWLLRRLEKRRATINVRFGQARFSADNAAGVAAIGMRRLLTQQRIGG